MSLASNLLDVSTLPNHDNKTYSQMWVNVIKTNSGWKVSIFITVAWSHNSYNKMVHISSKDVLNNYTLFLYIVSKDENKSSRDCGIGILVQQRPLNARPLSLLRIATLSCLESIWLGVGDSEFSVPFIPP